MDANMLITVIGSVGFPIVACLGMAWWVKYSTDQNNARMDKIQTEHKEEIQKVTEALNNNTLALQKLCTKLEKDDDDRT